MVNQLITKQEKGDICLNKLKPVGRAQHPQSFKKHVRLHSHPFLPRAKEDVSFSLVAGVGLSLVTAPQHPHCARWQTFLMLGLAHPQEQEEKWVCIVTPSLQGPALLCTPRHPIQPFRLVDTSMNGMTASPANSSKGLKDCPRSSHHQDQPAHLVHPPGRSGGVVGCQSPEGNYFPM